MRETGTGQKVAQLHEKLLMMFVFLPGILHIYRENPQIRPQLLPVYFRFFITIIPSFDAIGDSPSVVK